MKTVTLSATFDGQAIRLDDAYPLVPGTRLLVTVQPSDFHPDHDLLRCLASQGLAGAYGNNEPEYTLADLKEVNPLYKGR